MEDELQMLIIMMAVFGFLGLAIMFLRLIMRRFRRQKFNCSDYLTMVAILCLMARTAFTAVVVLWGNNNFTDEYRAMNNFSSREIYQREVGGKFTIANRVNYNNYIWIQKAVVLLLYHQFLSGLDWPRRIINVYWVVLVVTYVVAQVTTFVECKPLHLYWQVMPDPGKCPQAPLQLMFFVTLNLGTDFMLIFLPMPWLIGMKRSIRERLQLVALFSVGFFVIAIGFVRLPVKWGKGTTQLNRNIWGSVEAFAAAVVANFPTLFALRRKPEGHASQAASYAVRSSARVEGLRKVEDKHKGGFGVDAVELENRPSGTPVSAGVSERHWEAWDKEGGKDDIVLKGL